MITIYFLLLFRPIPEVAPYMTDVIDPRMDEIVQGSPSLRWPLPPHCGYMVGGGVRCSEPPPIPAVRWIPTEEGGMRRCVPDYTHAAWLLNCEIVCTAMECPGLLRALFNDEP